MHNITNYSDYSKCVNHKLSSILENFVKVKKFSKVAICNLVDGFTAPSMSKFLANNNFGAVETKHNVYNQLALILDEEEFKPIDYRDYV